MKYITDDSVYDAIAKQFDDCGDGTEATLRRLQADIQALISANVSPVDVSHWEDSFVDGDLTGYRCFVCGGWFPLSPDMEVNFFDFCPRCGRKMNLMYDPDLDAEN